jgi:hypothetical protein
MMFGGFEAGWAYAPMPPAASAAVPRAVLHSSSRRVAPDRHRITVSFVQRRSTLARVHFIHVAKFLFLRPPVAGEEAAIDRHCMTQHEARGWAAQPYHGSGDFFRLTEASEGFLRHHSPHDFRIVILRDEAAIGLLTIPGQTALMRMPRAA